MFTPNEELDDNLQTYEEFRTQVDRELYNKKEIQSATKNLDKIKPLVNNKINIKTLPLRK